MLATASRLCLASLIAVGGLLLAPGSAYACSCVSAEPTDFVRWADVVVVGTVQDQDVDHPWWPTMSSGDPVTYEVGVHRVLKGTAGTPVNVESAVSSATCGVELSVGRTYLLYAERQPDGGLSANLCGGTHEVTPAAVQDAEALLGPASPPAVADPSERGSTTPRPWLAGGAAVTGSVLAAAATGVLLRRRSQP